MDTINNFVVGSGGDILDFSGLLGNNSTATSAASTDLAEDNDNAYTANASVTLGGDDNAKIAFLVDANSDKDDITTASGLLNALADGLENTQVLV